MPWTGSLYDSKSPLRHESSGDHRGVRKSLCLARGDDTEARNCRPGRSCQAWNLVRGLEVLAIDQRGRGAHVNLAERDRCVLMAGVSHALAPPGHRVVVEHRLHLETDVTERHEPIVFTRPMLFFPSSYPERVDEQSVGGVGNTHLVDQ